MPALKMRKNNKSTHFSKLALCWGHVYIITITLLFAFCRISSTHTKLKFFKIHTQFTKLTQIEFKTEFDKHIKINHFINFQIIQITHSNHQNPLKPIENKALHRTHLLPQKNNCKKP